MAPLIDQHRTWQKVEERLSTETDPILRRNLEVLLTHMKAEAALDMDLLMSTVSEKAKYQNFAQGGSGPEGKAAVQKFYEDFAATGAYKLEHNLDRLIVDKHCILTEGVMRMAYPGRSLAAYGITVADPEVDYLYEAHMAILWPIDDEGLFIGEDSYVGSNGFDGIAERPIDPNDIVLYRPAESAA